MTKEAADGFDTSPNYPNKEKTVNEKHHLKNVANIVFREKKSQAPATGWLVLAFRWY